MNLKINEKGLFWYWLHTYSPFIHSYNTGVNVCRLFWGIVSAAVLTVMAVLFGTALGLLWGYQFIVLVGLFNHVYQYDSLIWAPLLMDAVGIWFLTWLGRSYYYTRYDTEEKAEARRALAYQRISNRKEKIRASGWFRVLSTVWAFMRAMYRAWDQKVCFKIPVVDPSADDIHFNN